MQFTKFVMSSAMAISLAACANSSLTVERPYSGSFRTGMANIVADESRVEIDAQNREYTHTKMEEAFFGGEDPVFARGNGITVRYRYVGFNEGSQALRYLTGPIAGGSKVVLEVDFVSASGEILSTVRGEGSVSGGFVGGSNKSGIDKAIEEIAAYAQERFAN